MAKGLSTDRKLLYELIVGLETGDISKVASRTIGAVHQARWLTFSARIVRLYCSVPEELGVYVMENLERLVIFIVKVYFKVDIIVHRN